MTTMVTQLAMDATAASSSSSSSFPPYFVLIFIAFILLNIFTRASKRKKRANQENPQHQAQSRRQVAPNQRPNPADIARHGVAHQPANVPYEGTLLNGIPLRGYDTSHGHQTTGFANERMRAEAELKRQLDALDAARRAGQVTAEQYGQHRDAIFKNF